MGTRRSETQICCLVGSLWTVKSSRKQIKKKKKKPLKSNVMSHRIDETVPSFLSSFLPFSVPSFFRKKKIAARSTDVIGPVIKDVDAIYFIVSGFIESFVV